MKWMWRDRGTRLLVFFWMFLGLAISQPLTIVDANFDALLFGGALIAISHLIVCQYVAALELTPQVPIVVDAATSPKKTIHN
jgi:hypothetical protein